ncbi:hypothetical protein ACVWZZ_006115 [Bradyrhizobium sp. LM6.10]
MVAFSLFAQNVGAEFEEYKSLTPFLPMGFGDDMLRFNGIGERITGAMYNNNAPDAAAKAKFLEIVRWAAKQGLTVTIHWQEDKSVHELLDLYEEVNKETPIAPLRWSIAHLDNTTSETLLRMKALGIGWTMQDAMYLGGEPGPPSKVNKQPVRQRNWRLTLCAGPFADREPIKDAAFQINERFAFRTKG